MAKVRLEDFAQWYASALDSYCPMCGGHGFFPGPRGGFSLNVYCKNEDCRAGFNTSPVAPVPQPIGQVAHKLWSDYKRRAAVAIEIPIGRSDE